MGWAAGVVLENHGAILLVAAAFLDYVVGDPWGWLHPVQVMGWYINAVSELTWRYLLTPAAQRMAGVFLCASLVLGCGGGSWLVLHYLTQWQPWLAGSLEVVLVASCLAGRSLRQAAVDVLGAEDLSESRRRLSQYVGRDTENLSIAEIHRALLETVAENGVDGATAPWFYALLGTLLGIGALPLALAYKAASTLDSMVGYRREPYEHLGWASAKFEDLVTWVPCRLTVLTLALLSGRPLQVWKVCSTDGSRDPSPNSGWSEGVYAAILSVQLGGDNYYKGELRSKPLLGNADRPIDPETIHRALNWTRWVLLVWLVIALFWSVLWSYILMD
jgi:adenosylcobinamide-phosphate synthase